MTAQQAAWAILLIAVASTALGCPQFGFGLAVTAGIVGLLGEDGDRADARRRNPRPMAHRRHMEGKP